MVSGSELGSWSGSTLGLGLGSRLGSGLGFRVRVRVVYCEAVGSEVKEGHGVACMATTLRVDESI